MSIINPAEEQHREQLAMQVEELRGKVKEVTTMLDKVLGAENYTISKDGTVFDKLSEVEKTEEQKEAIAEATERLKKIYDLLKRIDPNVVGEVLRSN
jgi:RNA polymerase-binding transcription factor DksA